MALIETLSTRFRKARATNQTGAGGLIAINHAAMVAPQDGTFLTVASQGLLIFEATGQRGLQTSIGNFKWLGSFTQSNNVTVTWHTSKIKSIAAVLSDSTRAVFADPRLDDWGVAPPSRVRLAHAVTARGLDPAVLA